MSREQRPADPPWSTMLVLAWGALYLVAVEIAAFLVLGGVPPLDSISLWRYGLGLAVFAGGGFLVNSAPVLGLGLLAGRLRFASSEWLWPWRPRLSATSGRTR